MPSDPSPSPEVPEAMIAAAASAMSLPAAVARVEARKVLTAALRLHDPAGLERAARAYWSEPSYDEDGTRLFRVPWERLPQRMRDNETNRMRAALEAAGPIPPPASDLEDLRGTLRLVDDILNCSDPDRAIPGAQQVIHRVLKDPDDAVVYPDLVRVVLEPVASDPETVEQVAEALAHERYPGIIWDHFTTPSHREEYLTKARKLLALLLNTTDDKEAQGGR